MLLLLNHPVKNGLVFLTLLFKALITLTVSMVFLIISALKPLFIFQTLFLTKLLEPLFILAPHFALLALSFLVLLVFVSLALSKKTASVNCLLLGALKVSTKRAALVSRINANPMKCA